MQRDNCFDFLRFIFAFNVVLGHLTVIALFPSLNQYQYFFDTSLSVTGFFVISGFLIAQSYERSSLRLYFIKRAKRLLPAYLFLIICGALLLVLLSDLSAKEYYSSIDFWEYLGANLCFMNFLHPWLPGVFNSPLINDNAVNPSLWTLKIEIGFYMIIPILFLWFKKTKQCWFALLIIYVCAWIYQNGMHYLSVYTQKDLYAFFGRQLPGMMTYFSVGIGAYIYKDVFLRYKNYLIIPAVVIMIIERHFAIELFTPIAWGVIVFWAAYSLKVLNNFAKYGDISYGIYIYHGMLLKILLTLGCFSALGVWGASMVYLCLVIVVGLLSWHLLENRFLRRK